MSTVTPTQPLVSPPPTLAPLTPRRITVDEYERIIASGSLNEPKKIELIDGYMVTWIVNLVDRQVEVYADPGPAGYASPERLPVRSARPRGDRWPARRPDRRRRHSAVMSPSRGADAERIVQA